MSTKSQRAISKRKSQLILDDHGRAIKRGAIVVTDGPIYGRFVAIFPSFTVSRVLRHGEDFVEPAMSMM
jgi:hypothetical protein